MNSMTMVKKGQIQDYFRRHLHDDVFMQKRRDLSSFYSFVYTNTMKTHMQNEDF